MFAIKLVITSITFIPVVLLSGCTCGETYNFEETADKELAVVAASNIQWTGIAVSNDKRIFVSYPNRSTAHAVSVAELIDTVSVKNYPDESWNTWSPGANPEGRLVAVQSIFMDHEGSLWILDSGNPERDGQYTGVVEGGAKLLQVNLSTNKVLTEIRFGAPAITASSILSNVTIDEQRRVAYVTDSNQGTLLVVDLDRGSARRVLAGDVSTKSENLDLIIDGQVFVTPGAQSNAKNLALTPDGGWLYWRAATRQMLYRINTNFLRNESLSQSQVSANVEKVEVKFLPPSDGMIMGPDGTLYVASMEMHAILGIRNNTFFRLKQNKTLLHWPSSFSIAKGSMYIINSQPDPGQTARPYRILMAKVPVPKG